MTVIGNERKEIYYIFTNNLDLTLLQTQTVICN